VSGKGVMHQAGPHDTKMDHTRCNFSVGSTPAVGSGTVCNDRFTGGFTLPHIEHWASIIEHDKKKLPLICRK